MPRKPRKYIEASFFHIMVQGIKKEYIFNSNEDRKKYCKLLTKDNKIIDIIAYCIMNNHTHILIYTPNVEEISRWMHEINTKYALYYNKTYDRVGYVFRDRYKMQVISNIGHLYRCVDYIHKNPVKAGICINEQNYEYSSLQGIYNSENDGAYNKIDNILNQLNSNEERIKCNTSDDENIVFLEVDVDKQNVCELVLRQYLKEYKMTIENLKNDKTELKKIVCILRKDYNISYRIIANSIGIGRETLRKLLLK